MKHLCIGAHSWKAVLFVIAENMFKICNHVMSVLHSKCVKYSKHKTTGLALDSAFVQTRQN